MAGVTAVKKLIAVADAERTVAVYESPPRCDDNHAIEAWHGSLPMTVGLFACYDIRGR